MSVESSETTAQGLILTDAAAAKVKSLLEQQGEEGLQLRVAVQPGGCSGLRYQLFFDDRSMDGDVGSDFGGVSVVTDRMSAPYLKGASIDFVDTIEKQGFTIDNPNATGSCACGDSFKRSTSEDPGTLAVSRGFGMSGLGYDLSHRVNPTFVGYRLPRVGLH